MGYVNTGTSRSLKVSVNKLVGGNQVQGYPKTYDGQQSWGNPSYATLTDTQLRQLSDTDFNTRYAAFVAYVESVEGGLDFDTDVSGTGASKTDTSCVAVTTTTTAATTSVTTTPVVTPIFLATPINGNTLADFDGLTINGAISAGITDSAHVYQKYVAVTVSELQEHTPYGYTIYNNSGLTVEFNGPEEYMAVIDTGLSTSQFQYQVYINALGGTHLWISL